MTIRQVREHVSPTNSTPLNVYIYDTDDISNTCHAVSACTQVTGDIKVANCGIVYPVTLPIALHPNPIGKKLKLLLSCDPMQCNEFFLDICHIDYYILNQTVHIV